MNGKGRKGEDGTGHAYIYTRGKGSKRERDRREEGKGGERERQRGEERQRGKRESMRGIDNSRIHILTSYTFGCQTFVMKRMLGGLYG